MKSLEEIRRIKEQAEEQLLRIPGVTGIDTGVKYVNGAPTGIQSIRVYVQAKRDVPEAEAVPKMIQGVPTDVVERRFVLHS